MRWQGRKVAALLGMTILVAGSLSGARAGEPQAKLVVRTYALNDFLPMLDGQWEGASVASDGNCYFGSSSHTWGHGSAFFKYDPAAQKVTMLAEDMSKVCGEDPAKVPPQGKIHSSIVEHKGWLYFGTHLSIYTAEANTNYTGGHVVGYELSTGKFRDFGILRANHSIYAGLALDAKRGKIYIFTTPSAGNPAFYGGGKAVPGEGPRLWRMDLTSGAKEELGKVGEGGDACIHLWVDPRGDCWFVPLFNLGLFCARAETGKIERWDIPKEQTWRWVGPHPDGQRAVVSAGERTQRRAFYVFDPEKAPAERVQKLLDSGSVYSVAADGRRIWYTQSRGRRAVELCSLEFPTQGQVEIVVRGELVDQDGRRPQRLGGLASDGKGRVYFVGDWYKLPGEKGSLRNGQERETVHRFGVVELPEGR